MAQPSASQKQSESRTSPALTNTISAAGVKRKRAVDKKFYAVRNGKRPGVYETWDECLSQVRGHKGAQFKAFPSVQEAQAFVEGRLPSSSSASSATELKFYGVQVGKVPGVYTDWPTAQTQIVNFKNPKYKRFSTKAEAEAFVAAGKKQQNLEVTESLDPETQARKSIIRSSAPGLVTNGTYAPKDREGNLYELGRAPLPPGAEDGFDPNIKLTADGTIVHKTEDEKTKTKSMVRGRNPPGMLRIYTDGSSLKNGQVGARAGVGVYFGPQDPNNVSEALKGQKQTNQRAELTAILRALEIAPHHRQVTIYTDSKYSIDCVTDWYKGWLKNGWMNSKGKPVENRDLIAEIRDKIDERDLLKKDTYFVWVKGHANDAGNVAADRLAVEGAYKGREVATKTDEMTSTEYNSSTDVRSNSDIAEHGSDKDELAQAYHAMEEAMKEEVDD